MQALTTLNLTCNKIGTSGVEYFSEALKMNTVLTTLILGCQYSENGIGDIGIQYLSEALKQNKVKLFEKIFLNYLIICFSIEDTQKLGCLLESDWRYWC